MLAALDGTPEDKLSSFALCLVLSDHIAIPHESQPDLVTKAEQVFVSSKAGQAKAIASGKEKPAGAKASLKKEATRKKAA